MYEELDTYNEKEKISTQLFFIFLNWICCLVSQCVPLLFAASLLSRYAVTRINEHCQCR